MLSFRGVWIAVTALWCSVWGASAEDRVLPPEQWPGPLVEIKDLAGNPTLGYLTNMKDGVLKVYVIKSDAEETYKTEQIGAMRFVPPPAQPAPIATPQIAATPPPTQMPPVAPEPKATSPETAPPPAPPPPQDQHPRPPRPDDAPALPGEARGPLRKLPPRERERYLELTKKGLFGKTKAEDQEFEHLRKTMGLPAASMYVETAEAAKQAQIGGPLKFEQFIGEAHRALKGANTEAEIEKAAASLAFALYLKGEEPDAILRKVRFNAFNLMEGDETRKARKEALDEVFFDLEYILKNAPKVAPSGPGTRLKELQK